MSEDLVNIVMNIHQFNQDLTTLNIKYAEEIERLNNIIKEIRELVENGTDFKSIYFKKDEEDLWKVILSDEIKEKYLEILDKGE